MTVDTKGSDNGTDIAVYTGTMVAALNPVPGACALYAAAHDPHVTFSASGGTTYDVQIDSHGGTTLTTVAAPPPNDDFAAATILAAMPGQDAVPMRGASVELGESVAPICGANNVELSVWYSFTPAVSQSLVVSSSYGGTKSVFTTPQVAVFTGSTLNNLIAVSGACNTQPNNAQTDLTVPVTAATQYFIRVGHYRAVDPTITTTTTFQTQ